MFTSPIQRAQPELAASAAPANRTPHAPLPGAAPRNFNQSQGAAVMVTLVPSAKSAITSAPSTGPPAMAATNSAEYNKPQGNSAHSAPSTRGAPPVPAPIALAFAHTLRPTASTQTGCRAVARSTSPRSAAATWNRVQTGRSAADCTVSQPRPCMDAAASAPRAE